MDKHLLKLYNQAIEDYYNLTKDFIDDENLKVNIENIWNNTVKETQKYWSEILDELTQWASEGLDVSSEITRIKTMINRDKK